MKRQVDIEEISDGKLYSSNDMVKADTQGCDGCCDCCCGMGDSIILDPLDASRLTEGLSVEFQKLLDTCLELNVVDGIILPNLRMTGEQERCFFLNEEGKCMIHAIRPGICRLFPLGRFYKEESFRYFLQIHECKKQNRSKIKVKKWLDLPDLQQYERYINTWHYFLEKAEQRITSSVQEEQAKAINVQILNTFYFHPISTAVFYEQFEKRIIEIEKTIL